MNDRTSSLLQYNTALKLARKGKIDEAERRLRLLLGRHGDHPDALHLLGVVLLESGRPMEAMDNFRDAIVRRPKVAQFHYHYAIALLRSGDMIGAEKAFNATIEIDPDFHDARYNLAKLNKDHGNFNRAIGIYKILLKRSPNHADALYNLANLYFEMDILNEAETLYNRLLVDYPQHLDARVNLAMLKDRRGNKDQAYTILQKTLDIDPAHKHANDLLRRMLSKWVPSWHFDMLNDEERNNAYRAAIENVASRASHVLEIGTGSGLLAMMAARAGASQVTTCEMVKPLATIARKIVEKNGYGNRIRVVSKKSTQLEVGKDLDTLADVLIAEVFDNGLLGEHFLPALLHAKQNLLTENAVVVPLAATIYGVLISCSELRRVNPIHQIAGFDLSDFNAFSRNGYKQINLKKVVHQTLSEPTAIYHLDFRKEVPKARKEKISLRVEKSGTCHALAFWYDLHLDEKNTISTLNHADTNHWKQAIQFFPKDYQLTAGNVVDLMVIQSQTGFEFAMKFPDKVDAVMAGNGTTCWDHSEI